VRGDAVTHTTRGVVFDLDGTLVDSWKLHLRCLRGAGAALGMGRISAAALAAAQRPTDVDTLRELVGEGRLGLAFEAYRALLHQELTVHPCPAPALPHVQEGLAGLRHAGVAVGICTGRSRRDAQALLDANGLDVAVTVAREDVAQPKPAPDGLLLTLRRLGLPSHAVVYVGDRPTDVEQGNAAGVRTLLCCGPQADQAAHKQAANGGWTTDLSLLIRELLEDGR
jgi:HAD superfamily hydrolase (TIGR01509 family)